MSSKDVQQNLQSLSDEYSDLQGELQSVVTARQKLESQQQENKSVKSEFATLNDDTNIYKMVGPILLKQDLTEAKSTVDGRLEFIEKEIVRIEDQITSVQQKSESKKLEIMHLQSQMQQQAPTNAA